jgi:serine/threonine protein kinase
VVLYAMLFGTVPFKATNMQELQTQIINLQCSWGTAGEISPSALTFLKKVLEVDPNKRLTPVQILNDPWMYLSEQQMAEINVFSENEKQKIESEFMYYTTKAEDKNDDPFLEQELQTTQNSEFKNNSTKSIILAPFNSTRTHISDNYLENEGIL